MRVRLGEHADRRPSQRANERGARDRVSVWRKYPGIHWPRFIRLDGIRQSTLPIGGCRLISPHSPMEQMSWQSLDNKTGNK